jgi:hypothetical protein
MSELNIERILKIEPDSLDIAWLEQASNYHKIAELAAAASEKVRFLKERLDITDSKLDKEYRKKFEVEKIKATEAIIKSYIIDDERHSEAFNALNEAMYRENVLKDALKAMDHKKSALENEVRLWAGSYFAGPKEPRDIQKEWSIKEEESDNIRKKMIQKSREKREE